MDVVEGDCQREIEQAERLEFGFVSRWNLGLTEQSSYLLVEEDH